MNIFHKSFDSSYIKKYKFVDGEKEKQLLNANIKLSVIIKS